MSGQGRCGGGSDGDRAESLFADWLGRLPVEPPNGEASLRALCRQHPDLEPELRSLGAGHRRVLRDLAALRDAIGTAPSPVAVPRAGRIWIAAAAVLVSAAGIGAWRIVDSGTAEVRARVALLVAVKENVDEVLSTIGGNEADALLAAETRPAGSEAARGKLGELERRLAEVAELLDLAGREGEALADRVVADAGDLATAERIHRECLSAIGAGSGEDRRAQALSEARRRVGAVTFAGSPLTSKLAGDRIVRRALERVSGDAPLQALLERIVALSAQSASIRLRVIDLDDGGREVKGAAIWRQEAQFPTGLLDAPERVGESPLDDLLPAGDWRITVVAPDGLRHSELRVLATPGADLGLRVAFLRPTDGVTEGMARRPAASVSFVAIGGTPPADADPSLTTPTAEVPELWIDPHETSKEQWAAFWNDLAAHPEWFDGEIPIPRPRFLDDSGAVPESLRRHPMESIDWEDAVLFANWSGKRLPTSAEWQRVAAGAEGRAFAWGDEFDPDAVDLSHSLAAAALEAIGKGGRFEFTPLDLDTLAGVEVDDPARRAGATPAADGDAVYRLLDNVSEWVEDLYVDWNRDGAPETTVATSVVRTTRGSNFQFILPESCGTRQRDGAISVSYGRNQTLGLRCVKTRLDPAFLRSD